MEWKHGVDVNKYSSLQKQIECVACDSRNLILRKLALKPAGLVMGQSRNKLFHRVTLLLGYLIYTRSVFGTSLVYSLEVAEHTDTSTQVLGHTTG